MKEISVGSDYSGIGAFNQALKRSGIPHKHVFACDMDRYARKSYIANYLNDDVAVVTELPKSMGYDYLNQNNAFYFPKNVYDRQVPPKPLDVYMTSPPCQAFSIAGKRKGEDDDRGVLFYNSHDFIRKNKPRFFIFENVKGLLSHDKDKTDKHAVYGRTFNKWVQYLGGKSINGNPVLFPISEAVPYHIYYKVLNATDYGVPQNRERIFIIGIRDDKDNHFRWPKPYPLTKRLIDVLEAEVDEKYFLSDTMLKWLTGHSEKSKANGNGFNYSPKDVDEVGNCVNQRVYKMGVDDNYIQVPSATKQGFEEAGPDDSIDLQFPDSETRRGRVGKGVAQTLDTSCNQGVCIPVLTPDRTEKRQNGRRFKENGDPSFTITTQDQHGVLNQNPNVEAGENYIQWDTSGKGYKSQQDRAFYENGTMGCLGASNTDGQKSKVLLNNFRIRRLTPTECNRLMDFPSTYKIVVSDTQAYKQAGNSIVVNVLYHLLKKLPL